MSGLDSLQKLLDKNKAKVYYQNSSWRVGLQRNRMYIWYAYDWVTRCWAFSGTTLTKGRGVSKHYHVAH